MPNLQLAAEAFLIRATDGGAIPAASEIRNRLEEGNFHASRFLPEQAAKFVDGNAGYLILAQYRNDPQQPGASGFSGTLVQSFSTGELTLSFRSTEFFEDAVRDTISTGDQEIRQLGWAFGQIAEMEAWYTQLRADPNLLGGKSFNVTGYSLGGHLATAFNILRREESTETPVISTYTFNGAGVGDTRNGRRLTDILADFNRLRSSADITATEDWLALSVDERQLISSLAASRVAAINSEAARLAKLQPRETFQLGLPPAGVQATLQYQIAALMAARDTIPSSNFPLPGGVNYFPSTPVFAVQPISNMVEVVGMETGGLGTSFVSNSGIHYGSRQEVAIEAQPRLRGSFSLADLLQGNLLVNNPDKNNFGDSHSLVLLIESLSVMAAMERLAPDLTIETAGRIFAAASNVAASTQLSSQGKAEGDTLERIVDSLYKLLVGSAPETYLDYKGSLAGNTWSRDEFRQPLYARLQEVNGKITELVPATGLSSIQMAALDSHSADGLLEGANDVGTQGLAYKYALRELNPFVVLDPGNVGLYARYMVGGANAGELDYYDASIARLGMTQQYLEDRAAFLERKLFLTTSNLDKNYLDPANPDASPESGTRAYSYQMQARHYEDRASGFVASTGGNANALQHIVFGAVGVDLIHAPVSGREDWLYGGAGSDFIVGNYANDYLEGGTGLDVYQFVTGDGADTLLDTDGEGELTRNGAALRLGIKDSAGVWVFGGTTYTPINDGKDLEITFADLQTDKITIKDFDFTKASQDGYLGLRLMDAESVPTFGMPTEPQTRPPEIRGDLEPLIENGAVPALYIEGPPERYVPDLSGHPDWRLASITGTNASPDNPPTIIFITYGRVDANENLIVTATPAPWRGDTLHDSQGDDKILAGEGENTIFATRGGHDWIVTGSGPDSVTDSGGNNLIDTGAGDDDVLANGLGDDWILAGEGSDLVHDFGGNNWIDAGAGDDTVLAGDGDDLILGGSGNDWIGDDGGANLIEAGADLDIVVGGVDADWIEGGADGDILDGNQGNDTLFADTSNGQTLTVAQAIAAGETGSQTPGPWDLLSGNEGNDILIGALGADYLAGGEGRDVLAGGAGDDTIYGDQTVTGAVLGWSVIRTPNISSTAATFTVTRSERFTATESAGSADTIYGGAGKDWIFAGAGDDYVEGGNSEDDANEDDDVVLGEGGNDIIVGGSGKDYLDGDSAQANDDGTWGDDYLDGGAGDDTLFGSNGDDILIGGAGEDKLLGGDGNDVLYGGADADVLQGGTGKDAYVYNRGDGEDVVIDPDFTKGSPYLSSLALGPGITRSDVKFRLGSLMIDLGDGDAIHFEGFNPDDPLSTPVLDSIQFADGDFMTYQDVLDQGFDLDGTEGDDYIKGTAVTDRIDAKSGNDIIEAGAGNDLIVTGAGADIVFGNAGDDRIVAGDGDLIIDLEGANTLDLTAYAGLTQANLEITQYRAPDGDNYLNFHVRDDLNPGATPATGGVSVQYGEIGNFASVTVSNGAEGTVELSYEELMTQHAAHGLVYSGTAAAELLVGTQHGDTFFGGAGADTIRAGAGDDKFDGGAGDDLLEGGAGNDTYLLGYNRGRDTVVEDGAAEPNASHTILLDAGIPSSLIYARQSGNDLEVRLRATGDALVLKDFYLQPQTWQDSWQVHDSNGALTDLAGYVPVIPSQAATWLEDEEQAYRARREQVFAANRQADGFLPLGGNVFQHTQQAFDYAGASVQGSTSILSLVAESQSSDAAQIAAGTGFGSTPIGNTTAVVSIGLPAVQGAGGERTQVSAGFGTGGASSGACVRVLPECSWRRRRFPAERRGPCGSSLRADDRQRPRAVQRRGARLRERGRLQQLRPVASDRLQRLQGGERRRGRERRGERDLPELRSAPHGAGCRGRRIGQHHYRGERGR